jgi:RNA polymerase sigma factor (sigma-70 family)
MSLNTHILHDLLQKGRADDPRAWDEVLAWVELRLKQHVARKMRSQFADMERWIEATDAMQVARMRLIQYLKQPEHTPVSTRHLWGILGTIVHRTLVDFVRRDKEGNGFARKHESYTDGRGNQANTRFNEVPDAGSEATYLEVLDAIEHLPFEVREAIRMRFLLQMTVEQVAEALGVSTGKASGLISEGRAEIRRLFQ